MTVKTALGLEETLEMRPTVDVFQSRGVGQARRWRLEFDADDVAAEAAFDEWADTLDRRRDD